MFPMEERETWIAAWLERTCLGFYGYRQHNGDREVAF